MCVCVCVPRHVRRFPYIHKGQPEFKACILMLQFPTRKKCVKSLNKTDCWGLFIFDIGHHCFQNNLYISAKIVLRYTVMYIHSSRDMTMYLQIYIYIQIQYTCHCRIQSVFTLASTVYHRPGGCLHMTCLTTHTQCFNEKNKKCNMCIKNMKLIL